VQCREFEQGLPLKQLCQIQGRSSKQSLGARRLQQRKVGQVDSVTACASCAVLGLGCPSTVDKRTSPEWGSEGTSPRQWLTVWVCRVKPYSGIVLTHNRFCRLGQRGLCLIRSPVRERESYLRRESDNVESLL